MAPPLFLCGYDQLDRPSPLHQQGCVTTDENLATAKKAHPCPTPPECPLRNEGAIDIPLIE